MTRERLLRSQQRAPADAEADTRAPRAKRVFGLVPAIWMEEALRARFQLTLQLQQLAMEGVVCGEGWRARLDALPLPAQSLDPQLGLAEFHQCRLDYAHR